MFVTVFGGKIIIKDREHPEDRIIVEDVSGVLKVITDWIDENKDSKENRVILHLINKPIHQKLV